MSDSFSFKFKGWIELCIQFEEKRNLSKKSISELHRYFNELLSYIKEKSIYTIKELSPSFFTDFLSNHATGENAPHIKALVWSLRKLGAFLFLKGILPTNPTTHLRHPKISKRAKIPHYLTAEELSRFLMVASKEQLMDFCIVSLLSTAGLRTDAVAQLHWDEVLFDQDMIKILMKGGWYTRIPISDNMSGVLAQLSEESKQESPFVFTHKGSSPVSHAYIRKLVRETGEKAKIPFSVTPRHLRHTFGTFGVSFHSLTFGRPT